MIRDHEVVSARISRDAIQGLLTITHTLDEVAFAAQRDAGNFAKLTHIVGIKNAKQFFRGR